jgi:hypothetical protein
MIAADSNGTLSSILTTESLCMVWYGANVAPVAVFWLSTGCAPAPSHPSEGPSTSVA